MVSGCRTFPTQPIQWWLSPDVWWFFHVFSTDSNELWLSLSFFGACPMGASYLLRLATSMTSPSLVLFFAKGYGPRHLETDFTRGEGGWGMEMIPIDSRENRGSIMRRYGNSSINAGFLQGKKWRHSGCSPAMLDYWYFGGSWDLTKMVEKLDWPDFSVKGATADWIKYIQVFMS